MDPFLYGDVPGAGPQHSAWLRGLQHVEQILERWGDGVDTDGYWWTPAPGLNPLGALVRHIGGSSMRLLHYAQGAPLPDSLREEGAVEFTERGAAAEEVYTLCVQRLQLVRHGIEAIRPAEFDTVREVGRKRLPVRTTIIVQHLLEHAHGHAGQVIFMRKLYDAGRSGN